MTPFKLRDELPISSSKTNPEKELFKTLQTMTAVSEIQRAHCKCPNTPSKSKSSSHRSDKFQAITVKIIKNSTKIEI